MFREAFEQTFAATDHDICAANFAGLKAAEAVYSRLHPELERRMVEFNVRVHTADAVAGNWLMFWDHLCEKYDVTNEALSDSQ